jgi:hypothetical protein
MEKKKSAQLKNFQGICRTGLRWSVILLTGIFTMYTLLQYIVKEREYLKYQKWIGTAILAAAAVYVLITVFTDREELARQYSGDVDCTLDAVVALSRNVAEAMKKRGLSAKRCHILALLVEELGMHACYRAAGRPFQMEFSILPGDYPEADIIMIVRDNGKPYDIIKATEQGTYTFQEYFIEALTSRFHSRRYLAGGDENRMIMQIGMEK